MRINQSNDAGCFLPCTPKIQDHVWDAVSLSHTSDIIQAAGGGQRQSTDTCVQNFRQQHVGVEYGAWVLACGVGVIVLVARVRAGGHY